MKFFEGWRWISERLTRALIVAVGAITMIGGVELLAVGGPPWAAVLFIGFGLVILVGGALATRQK